MFFEGTATPEELSLDLIGTAAQHQPGFRSSADYAVEPMGREFGVEPAHLVKLIDAVLAGQLSRADLGTVLFCMEAAPNRWIWDSDDPLGERVADAVFWLGTPEVNYPLTQRVLEKVRVYLLTGENKLNSSDLGTGGNKLNDR